ncbi:type IV pilus modification PilV family protein [Jatrophihabitans sp. YIM 134969]
MPASRTLPPDHRAGGDDAGFTLIEVMVSVAIIAVVMLGLGAVFVATAAGTDVQGGRQAASRIATDGLDRAHALSGSAVVRGRDKASVDTQWATRPAGVSTLLAGLTASSDATARTGAGRAAALPTTPLTVTVDGVTYRQSFFVAGCNINASQTCLAAATTGTVAMYDVVVSVAWPDRSCPRGTCTYELSTLMAANTTEPLFNSNVKAVAPVVTMANGLTRFGTDVGETISAANGPKVVVAGGNGGVTLTAAGLPAGVTLDPDTGTFTGTLGAVTAGTTVTVTATDRFQLFGSTTFTWAVNALPKLTSATLPLVAGALQTVDLATALGLGATGTGPYTWACTGLSLGATVTAAGVLTVPAAAVGVLTPACTVTDSRGRSSTATLTAKVLLPLAVTPPAAPTLVRTVAMTPLTLVATGCSGACTWASSKLPAGLTMTSAGVVSGKPTTAGSTTITFTVTDAAGRTATTNVTWRVS